MLLAQYIYQVGTRYVLPQSSTFQGFLCLTYVYILIASPPGPPLQNPDKSFCKPSELPPSIVLHIDIAQLQDTYICVTYCWRGYTVLYGQTGSQNPTCKYPCSVCGYTYRALCVYLPHSNTWLSKGNHWTMSDTHRTVLKPSWVNGLDVTNIIAFFIDVLLCVSSLCMTVSC